MRTQKLILEDLPKAISYKVQIYMATFEEDAKDFEHVVEFKSDDVLISRAEAVKYFCETAKGIEKKGSFHGLPFTAYADSSIGETSSYCIMLMCYINVGHSTLDYCLYGDNDNENNLQDQAWEIVNLIEFGIEANTIPALLFEGIDKIELQDEVNRILRNRVPIQRR